MSLMQRIKEMLDYASSTKATRIKENQLYIESLLSLNQLILAVKLTFQIVFLLVLTSCSKEIDLDNTTPMVIEMVKSIPPEIEQLDLTSIAKKYIPLNTTFQEASLYLNKSGFEFPTESGRIKLHCINKQKDNKFLYRVLYRIESFRFDCADKKDRNALKSRKSKNNGCFCRLPNYLASPRRAEK